MKVDKMINIRLSEDEIKMAVFDYVVTHLPSNYVSHIRENEFMIDFIDGECVVLVDGIIDTSIIECCESNP
jgi:hypothetical protein